MITKVVYVVVSNGKDTYLEQVYISLLSLKRKCPEATSCVIVDTSTKIVITRLKYDLLEFVDDLVVIDVPERFKGAQCSRYIKTNLRSYITGPYLFVDTDTIIADSLVEIDEFVAKGVNISCVKDAHLPFNRMPTYTFILKRAKKIGWEDIKSDPVHYNSGVMFVNDNDFTRNFYKEWHKNWLYEYDKNYYYDQLALARTNRDAGYPIEEMPGEWNLQIFYGALQYLSDAKIIHYGGDISENRPYYFRNRYVFEELSSTGEISEFGHNCINNPKTAFVGKTVLIGDEYWDYFWSSLRIEYKFHAKRFKLWKSLADFFQKLSMKVSRKQY